MYTIVFQSTGLLCLTLTDKLYIIAHTYTHTPNAWVMFAINPHPILLCQVLSTPWCAVLSLVSIKDGVGKRKVASRVFCLPELYPSIFFPQKSHGGRILLHGILSEPTVIRLSGWILNWDSVDQILKMLHYSTCICYSSILFTFLPTITCEYSSNMSPLVSVMFH